MDIHPPQPVRESFHNGARVREPRENIRREIADNQRELDGELRGVPTKASRADMEPFRTQALTLRGEVYILQQIGKNVSEGYRKVLE